MARISLVEIGALMGHAPVDPPNLDVLAQCIRKIACAGDRHAFAALFTHFAPRLKTFFIRGGMTHAQAEELAQEAMIAVWRKAVLFEPDKANAATWVYAIARNLRIDALRRGATLPSNVQPLDVASHSEAMAKQDVKPGADEAMAMAQRLRGLREALLALPEDQAELLDLSYFGGRSHTEIARMRNLPLGTVKSRMRLALARLRRAMGEDLV